MSARTSSSTVPPRRPAGASAALLLVLAALALPAPSAGQSAVPAPGGDATREGPGREAVRATAGGGADLAAEVRDWVRDAWPDDGPGASVVVTRDGEPVVETAQGLADLETGEPLTPSTVFQLGSTTKQFTAAVVLQLAEAGELELDAPVSTYLPDYSGPGTEATLRQLLGHTAGVPNYTDITDWWTEENRARPHTTSELVDVLEDEVADFAPGVEWSYSNSNYLLLGAVVEEVTGHAWYEAVRRRVTAPLGLETLRYGGHESVRARTAEGYTPGDDGPEPAVDVHPSAMHAAGGLAGSAPDLAAWMHALHTGEVVGRDGFEAMTTPVEPNDSMRPYGFGLRIEEVRGHEAVTHGGWVDGFTNQTVFLPGEDVFVAVLSNSDDPATSVEAAARRIAARTVGDPYPTFEAVEPDLDALEPLFGVYEIEGSEDTRQFYARDGKLYTLRSGSSESRVWWAGGDRFFYGPRSLTWFEIVRDDDGWHRMEMHQRGRREAEVAVRTGPVPERPEIVDLPAETLEAYVGEYRLEPEVFVTVTRDEGGLTARITGQDPATLRPVGEAEFLVEGIDAKVVFQKEDGEVTGLVIHQGGETVPAERVEGGG